MIIEIVADFVCPWCYIGKRRLERALAMRPGQPFRASWRVFQLNPDMPVEGIPRQVYLSAKFGSLAHIGRIYDAITEAGAEEGLSFHFERIERTPNSVLAHRLGRFAARLGRQPELIEALFRAYFTEGRDIGRLEVLTELAGEAGLDPGEAARFLASDAEHQAVEAEDRMMRRLGISGVPCFIIEGKYALSGAQEPEFFLPLFDLARRQESEAEASPAG